MSGRPTATARTAPVPRPERDRARDARLTGAGFRVVRFTYRQVASEVDGVATTLIALLRSPSA